MSKNKGKLEKLDNPFKTALISLYNGDPQIGIDGRLHKIDKTTRISLDLGMWLYNFCLTAKPKSTLEIGMAYGYSTLYFLAAISKNRIGKHTAIDPFQQSNWHGIGLRHAITHAPKWGEEESFWFIEDRSDRVAADIARGGYKYDLVFIDGNHRFDDVLVDFYLYAQICSIGGLIILDDTWMSSVRTVINFIHSNRKDFKEISSIVPNVAIFQKIGDDQRKWNEFVKFKVGVG